MEGTVLTGVFYAVGIVINRFRFGSFGVTVVAEAVTVRVELL